MIALICFVLAVLASPFKSKSRLEAENAALRHQLIVLRRKRPGRPWLTNNDRWFFLQMYRWFPAILEVVRIIRRRAGIEPPRQRSIPPPHWRAQRPRYGRGAGDRLGLPRRIAGLFAEHRHNCLRQNRLVD
jgi:hypothetical protein